MLDVVIVGGSSAGLSAALVLGRSLRRVVVVDDQKPCNRFSHASHGFLTRDGVAPSELLQIARDQLRPYATVSLHNATVASIEKGDAGFTVVTSDGASLSARRVLLATGLRDELPPLDGVEALWGTSVFHCPYCDGYEIRDKAVAVYGTGDDAQHLTMLVRNLTSRLTLCPAAGWTLTPDQLETLSRHGIDVIEQPIIGLVSSGAVLQAIRFADGTQLTCDALFLRPRTSHRTTFAYDLGCEIDPNGIVQIDRRGQTTVAGVYAAGDISSPMRSVAIAVAQGAAAGYGINADLAHEDFS